MNNSVKAVLLGDSGVGKTCIVSQYVIGSAPINVKPTIGAAFLTKRVNYEGNDLELLVWDTAGQEVYRGLAPMYYRNAVIAIIVYDITIPESFNSVQYWLEELEANSDQNLVITICGNKLDLEEQRKVESSAGEALANSKGGIFIEVCAKTGASIDRLFQLSIQKYLASGESAKKTTAGVELETNKNSSKCC
ncbi:small GTP-binding protein [Tritrichomonas foetus]|uniref:Small GTP-binding protein n=1 Tax=Tritrichomonas foetus TaxID=1144522 RepID=A0A1J4KA02_9EUKA|nr:small GTP-binding protein [Tritrichomonas foetus]|eukprot:OHT06277.1 small GTP-binding protein [Tritrichomonas foetus]